MNPPPTDPNEIIDKCVDLIEQLEILLNTTEPLDLHESRKMPSMTKTRASALPSVARICNDAGLERIGTETTSGMLQAHEEGRSIGELLGRAQRIVARLDARRRRADYRCIANLSMFYGALKLLARNDELIGPQLAPLEAAFRGPKRRKRAPSSPVVSPEDQSLSHYEIRFAHPKGRIP